MDGNQSSDEENQKQSQAEDRGWWNAMEPWEVADGGRINESLIAVIWTTNSRFAGKISWRGDR